MAVELISAYLARDFYYKIKNKRNKYSRGYVKYQIKQLSKHMEDLLSQFYCIKDWDKASKLYPVVEDIKGYIAQIRQLAEGLDKPFLLFLVGMGKYGKSTLLNALLGKQIAEVDVIPKTWKIDIYQKKGSDTEKVEIVFKDGSVKLMGFEEAKLFLENEERKRMDSEDRIYEMYRQEVVKYKTVEEKEELRAFLEKTMLYISPVVEVRWPVESNGKILDNFRLVDTPGLEQKLLGKVKESINEYYHKADGVIWLLDATVISAQKARQLLDDLKRSLELVGGKTDNIIAVLNCVDKVRKIGGEEAVREVYSEAIKIYGDLFEDIIPISAKEAIEGMEKNDQAMIERSGINNLIEAINNTFLPRASGIQITSKIRGLKSLLAELAEKLSVYQEELRENEDKRLNMVKELRRDRNATYKQIKTSVQAAFSEYANLVKNNIETLSEQLFDKKREESELFLKNEIFMADKVDVLINELLSEIRDTIMRFYSYHANNSVFKEFPLLNVGQIVSDFEGKFDIVLQSMEQSLNEFEDVKFGVGAATIIGAGLLLGPLGFVVASILSTLGVARWIAKQFQLPKLKERLYRILEDFVTKSQEKILKDYVVKQLERAVKHVNSVRETTFANLYGGSEYVSLQMDVIENFKALKDYQINGPDLKTLFVDLDDFLVNF